MTSCSKGPWAAPAHLDQIKLARRTSDECRQVDEFEHIHISICTLIYFVFLYLIHIHIVDSDCNTYKLAALRKALYFYLAIFS